ncbi:hypothetical protein B0H14DRAFT_3760655 [Mycena olivaceomarginata]|nr:hypothetical protein B0H14DRAFT_3760655 [Mycena olivaceomarginata]
MSSTPHTTPSKDTPNPVSSHPTLHIIPSYTYTPTIDPNATTRTPLRAIPAAAEAEIGSIMRSAVNARSAPVAVDVNTTPRDALPIDSDDASAPEAFDPELEEWLHLSHQLVPDKEKGKGKAQAPPSPQKAPLQSRTPLTPAASIADAVLVASSSGSSRPAHPFHRDAGFEPDEVLPKDKTSAKDHKITRQHVNGVLVAATRLHDKVERMGREISEFSTLVPLVQQQLAEVSAGTDQQLVNDLVHSLNANAGNVEQHGVALDDITIRLLPPLLVRIQQLEAMVSQLDGTAKRLTGNVQTLELAAVGPAPTTKRPREEEDIDLLRNVRPRAGVTVPNAYIYAPPLSSVAPAPAVIAAPAAPIVAPPPQFVPPPAEPPAPLRAPTHAAPRAPQAPAATRAPAMCRTLLSIRRAKLYSAPSRGTWLMARPLSCRTIATFTSLVLPSASHYTYTTRRHKPHASYTRVTYASPRHCELGRRVVGAGQY